MLQIDNRTYQITTAIVDQYGNFMVSKEFSNLIPPREPRISSDGFSKLPMRPGEIEEREKHAYDKEVFLDLLKQYQVDLIVVAADCLEARKLKNALNDIASSQYHGSLNDNMGQGSNDVDDPFFAREVCWGRPEVPKLFAESHNS
jgi:hypothetical protein